MRGECLDAYDVPGMGKCPDATGMVECVDASGMTGIGECVVAYVVHGCLDVSDMRRTVSADGSMVCNTPGSKTGAPVYLSETVIGCVLFL